MVKPVDRIVPDFAKAGASIISFHPEASDHVDRTIALISEHGCKAGLVLNPGDAALVARPHARQARPGAADVGEPRLRRPGVHRARCCPRSRRCAGASRRSGTRYLARGRRRREGRQHRARSRAPAPTPSSPARRSSAPRTTRPPTHSRTMIVARQPPPLSSGVAGALVLSGSSRCSSHGGVMTERFQRAAATPYLLAEARADLDTPLALLKLAAPYSYLLESVVGGERFGRYSFIGLACAERIEARGGARCGACCATRAAPTSAWRRVEGDPFEYARAWLKRHRVAPVPAALRFGGGLAGYFGYEAVRHIEPRALRRGQARSARHARTCCCWSPTSSRWSTTCSASSTSWSTPIRAARRHAHRPARACEQLRARLAAPLPEEQFLQDRDAPGRARSNAHSPKPEFLEAVRRCEGIHLRRRHACRCRSRSAPRAPFEASPLALYRALRGVNPSPYMYYFDFGDHHVVGASPEILVRLAGDTVTLRPIAGTRPRGATPRGGRARRAGAARRPEGARRARDADRPRAATTSAASPRPAA